MSDPALLPRLARETIETSMRTMPVTVLTGARQTGKSTLLGLVPSLAEHLHLTLDDLDVRDQAIDAPSELLARGHDLVLDEVQRAPDLLLAMKARVDGERPRRPGRYLVTGSANLLLYERVSESLAGRAGYVTLWPLTRRELLGQGRPGLWSELFESPVDRWIDVIERHRTQPEDWRQAVRRGGLPVPAWEMSDAEARSVWFEGYVRTYLERDLQTLASISQLADFRRLMRICAARIGAIVNQASLGRDAGVPRPTTHRYLNLLETSYQVVRIPAYSVNRTKRLTRSPKLYWGDAGLGHHLSGSREPSGADLENLVALDLVAWRDARLASRPEVFHWRTTTGDEVDFVVELGGRLLAIEVKSSERPRLRDARHLQTFVEQYPEETCGALVLHGGDTIERWGEHIVAAPWWSVL